MTHCKNKTIGTLLPISSLKSINLQRGANGHGTIEMAMIFLDWLHATDQQAWQVLPLHETHRIPESATLRARSPYKGYGVGIDPGYLPLSTFKKGIPGSARKKFISKNTTWLSTYALFCALTKYFRTDDWTQWPPNIRNRDPRALREWSSLLRVDIDRIINEQYHLHDAFFALRKKAHRFGIQIIGDMSFYLPKQSPLVWEFADAFSLEKNGTLRFVSGLPNGPRAHYGRQVWGHPLYRWNTQRHMILSVWKIRLNYIASIYDRLRIDHAAGFYRYGVIDTFDADSDTLKHGPGTSALKEMLSYAKKIGIPLFAEDAGHRIPKLREALRCAGVPGIRIVRFLYNEKEKKFIDHYAVLDRYPCNTVAYTSTHDSVTLTGYLSLLSREEIKKICAFFNLSRTTTKLALAKKIRDMTLASPAATVIVPFQDWFFTRARINVPGKERARNDPNWRYKIHIPVESLPKTTH